MLNNDNYTHFAVNKQTNKIVNGWDYSGYDPEELRLYKKDYFIRDLIDMEFNPDDYKILTLRGCKQKGIDPNDNTQWANNGINESKIIKENAIPRESMINRINNLARVEGFCEIGKIQMDNGETGDFITDGALMTEIEGDWVYVKMLDEMSDEELERVYTAVQKHAMNIMNLAESKTKKHNSPKDYISAMKKGERDADREKFGDGFKSHNKLHKTSKKDKNIVKKITVADIEECVKQAVEKILKESAYGYGRQQFYSNPTNRQCNAKAYSGRDWKKSETPKADDENNTTK